MTPKIQTGTNDVTTTVNAAVATVTNTKPTNTVDDDTLLWVVGHRGPGALSAIPTGWTELASKFTTPYTLSVLYKKIPSAAAEVATSYTLTAPSSSRLCSAMFRVTDVRDAFDNVQGALSVITGTVNLILPTATSNSNYMLAIGVGFGGFAGNSGGAPYFTTPAGWNSCFIQDDLVINSASSSALCVYQKQLGVSGTVVPDLTVNINPIRPASNTEGFMLLLASKSGQDTSGSTKPSINQQIIAHRGTLGSADPKTEEQLSGIALLSSECNGVELDVQLASDSLATTKKAYLCHDATVDRTSPNGTTGTVTSMTSAQLDAAQIMDLASYLTGIASKNYSTIMLQLYDASSPAIKIVSDICLASPLKDRIIFMLNAAGTQSTANLQMSNVRANWQGKAGVFQQTPTNWVFYQALYSTYSFKYAAITQGDPAYVTDRAHVQTLMSAGVNVIGSVLDGTSIPLAIQDNIFAILTNVSTTIINTYDVPDNVALPPSGSKIMSVTDNEMASLVSVYGPGLSISDMRRKKWAGDLKTSMNDLEKAYYAGNDPWSLSEEQYKAMGGDPKNSLSDNNGSFWSGAGVVTVRNIVDRPAPVALTNWSSQNAAMWLHTYSGGVISVERLAGATGFVTAYVLGTGIIAGSPNLPAGSQWQRSVEVFSTVPVTVTFAPASGGYPTGQQIPANVWTTIRNNFIGSGSAQFVMAFQLVAASDPGLGILTQLRHAMLVQDTSTWRTNQAINPGYESGTNSIQTGSVPTYVLSADTVAPISGTKSALFTKSATASATIAQILCNIGATGARIPVTEGQVLTGGLSIKTDVPNAQVNTRWFWYDAALVLTQGAATTRFTNMTAGQTYRVSETGTAPPGTVWAYFCVTVTTASGNTVGGEKVWADLVTIENGTTDGSPLGVTNGLASFTGTVDASTSVVATKQIAYADGGSPGWTWEGTANASPSIGPVSYVPDRVNLVTNPGYESGTNSFFSNNGANYPITADTVAPIGGTRSAYVVRTGTMNNTVSSGYITPTINTTKFAVIEGQPITYGYSVKTDTPGLTVNTKWAWYDSGSVQIPAPTNVQVASTVAGQVYRVSEVGIPPVGAVTAWPQLLVTKATIAVGGEKIWYDYATVENGATDGSWF